MLASFQIVSNHAWEICKWPWAASSFLIMTTVYDITFKVSCYT
jgi:hypothetical protein